MADFGALFRADDGSLLVTSDTPCYELYGEFAPTSRSGNVNTYSVGCAAFPLIVVNCGAGGKAGVLAVEGGAGNWTVSVLANLSCNILAFIPISGSVTAGYGLAAYDASGRLVFDSFRKILNARHINSLYEGASFQSTAGVNSVAYTSGPVKPTKTESTQWVLLDYFFTTTPVYTCHTVNNYVCGYEAGTVWEWQTVCTPVFTCGTDMFGNFGCWTEQSCSQQYVAVPGQVYVCNWVQSQECGYEWVNSSAAIYGNVKTTTWTIDRGVASITGAGVVSFEWLRHKEGYYKEIIEFSGFSDSGTPTGSTPYGYFPPIAVFQSTEVYEGELTKNNTFPYTTDRANSGPLGCITAVRSDYD